MGKKRWSITRSLTDQFPDLLDGLTANLQQLTTDLNLPEGFHNLKLEVEDRAGNISEDYLFDILIDRTSPTCSGAIHPDSDSGVIGNPASFSDGITRDSAPRFTGTAEANAVISLLIDGEPVGSTGGASV